MRKLNINTPRGQAALREEYKALELYEQHHPEMTHVSTPKGKPARLDGVLVDREGVIRAVVESKARYGLTLEAFRTKFKNEWLLSLEKIEEGARVAELFCVPFVGFLYLVEDETLLTIQIADETGSFSVPFYVRKTETLKNINGGKALRNNAFISMKEARVFTAKVADIKGGKIYPWENRNKT